MLFYERANSGDDLFTDTRHDCWREGRKQRYRGENMFSQLRLEDLPQFPGYVRQGVMSLPWVRQSNITSITLRRPALLVSHYSWWKMTVKPRRVRR